MVASLFLITTPVLAKTESGQLRERIKETLSFGDERKDEREASKAAKLAKLQTIKDERRKALAEKLVTKMCDLPARRAEVFSRHLQSMTNILGRVETKGAGDAAVTAAVAKAETAIADAQAAVDAMAKSDCVVKITGEDEKLGKEVSSSRLALADQFKQVQAKVKTARKAVSDAIRVLARFLGESVPAEVSETPKPTPTPTL